MLEMYAIACIHLLRLISNNELWDMKKNSTNPINDIASSISDGKVAVKVFVYSASKNQLSIQHSGIK
ncbi:hypothetical protein DSL64_26690 [Dyadobacter luteus]|uniref:Uncharacterized protein n=1 Tax=Dyadobacter luteus TaxID=2259619 RepID=A0A3D8Y3A7_9BACT|nr:hypothetical protein [Dyadobacter luteus]REA56508.1 hypothetical protein DSL64_26690 [Dyadobacter luteus]